jgi:hypothetical protein
MNAVYGITAHFVPTNEAPENFSSTSKESNTLSAFPLADPLFFAFLGTSAVLLATASLGFSFGLWSVDRRDSATI